MVSPHVIDQIRGHPECDPTDSASVGRDDSAHRSCVRQGMVGTLTQVEITCTKTWCLEGSETETREVLGGTEDKSVSSTMVQ